MEMEFVFVKSYPANKTHSAMESLIFLTFHGYV